MVQEVILADRLHVGQQTLARLHAELLEGDALPLGGGLDDLRINRVSVMIVGDVESDRGSRTVPIEVVVDTAVNVDDERHLHHHQVELFGQVLFDVLLGGEHRLHGLLRVEER